MKHWSSDEIKEGVGGEGRGGSYVKKIATEMKKKSRVYLFTVVERNITMVGEMRRELLKR